MEKEVWNKINIVEFLDAIGQDEIKFKEPDESDKDYIIGNSDGDFGIIGFRAREGELRLKFPFEPDAPVAMDRISKALSNPYEFFSRFDMMPGIIIVRFTED